MSEVFCGEIELRQTSGTSFATIRLANPSRMAVLPTPGGPMSCEDQRFDTQPVPLDDTIKIKLTTGFDFVRLERT